MATHFFHMFTLWSFALVASEWVELPKLTVSRDLVTQSSREVAMASLQATVSQIFPGLNQNETTPLNSKNNKTNQQAKNSLEKQQNYSDITKANSRDSSLVTSDHNIDSDDSSVIEETINKTINSFVQEPVGGVASKLKYLKELENKLLIQTRMYTEGIWMERQSRAKKLLGFPSMEGALMTMAFLTFAVFLIKIVMQFIQGLQSAEQTLLLTLSTSTQSPIRLSNRPKREAQNLAAAQILRYIDEYSIKHKLHCDFK